MYAVFKVETNVNSKSQDRFIFEFSRYFTHYLYRTNIEIHEARDKKIIGFDYFNAWG